jgi:hypothetical protein
MKTLTIKHKSITYRVIVGVRMPDAKYRDVNVVSDLPVRWAGTFGAGGLDFGDHSHCMTPALFEKISDAVEEYVAEQELENDD